MPYQFPKKRALRFPHRVGFCVSNEAQEFLDEIRQAGDIDVGAFFREALDEHIKRVKSNTQVNVEINENNNHN